MKTTKQEENKAVNATNGDRKLVSHLPLSCDFDVGKGLYLWKSNLSSGNGIGTNPPDDQVGSVLRHDFGKGFRLQGVQAHVNFCLLYNVAREISIG